MENSEIKRERDWLKWVVYGTWALVGASLLSTWLVIYFMDKQVVELKKATELEWRPYLNIDHDYRGLGMYYRAGESRETDNIPVHLDSVSLSSLEFHAVRYVGYEIDRTLFLSNSGRTPLRLKRMIPSAMSIDEWEHKYKKSPELLLESILDTTEFKTFEFDVVIFPDSSRVTDTIRGVGRRMEKDLFLSYLHPDSQLVLYVYTYLEYEDFFDNEYNVLLIEHVKARIDSLNDKVVLPDIMIGSLEKYRWDVLLEERDF